MKVKNTLHIISFCLVSILFFSCNTPKDIAYFQDRKPGSVESSLIPNSQPFKVKPGDRISIYVKSRNEQLSTQFNISGDLGQNTVNTTERGYLVDDKGDIDFPVLGKLHVAGMNRQEITDYVTSQLRDSRLVTDAIVKVEYTGLFVTVLGEGGGKRIKIEKDKMTFFELLGLMGDLDINAIRKNVLVIREDDGKRYQFEIDLTRAENVYNSPAYYVHQNDIVYVEPNDKTKRNSTVNGNLFQTWGFWTGLTGLGMTAVSIINLFK